MARPLKSTVPPSPLPNNRDDEKRSGASKTKDLSHVPCKFFKAGQCTAGAACPFSHSAPEPGQPKQVCQWFVSGNCRFGHKCALAHIMPGESMSMDRKNKKAAQQAAQSGPGGQPQESGEARSATASVTGGAGPGRQSRKDKDKDKDRPSRRSAGGSAKASSSTRDRTSRSDRRETDSNASTRGEEGSITATLRPPIRIGKGPTISASVTAPPVLGDTSATPFSQLNDLEVDRSWATASLEQVQGHSRQSTIMPAIDNLALSDYSKTPSATVADLPPPLGAPSIPVVSSPKRVNHGSPLASSSLLTSARSANDVALTNAIRNGNVGGEIDPRTSPHLVHSETTRNNNFGPIGSPPRAGNGILTAASPGRGALSSIMAGLSMGAGSNSYNQQQFAGQRSDMAELKDGPSSITSQSSLHGHMGANTMGTSPFAVPGSRSLFMSYPGTGEPSSVTSQSNIPAYLGGGHGPLHGGVPASFAGSRAMGWGAGSDARRPSLPGHHQRPSMGGSSIRSSGLDENAFEEEGEEGDGLEGEEFLPSSLSNLLTKEEKARRFSRGGARPTKESIVGRGHDDDGDDDAWNETLRKRAMEKQNSAFSRSVPATSLLNNPRAMRSLWDNDASTQPLAPNGGLDGTGSTPFASMTRALSSNAATGHEVFGSLSGSYGPSPSMLSSSVMSNSSAAFLKTSRVGARAGGGVGAYGAEGAGGRISGAGAGMSVNNDLQIGSYNPQSNFYQAPANNHHHTSSISGISSAVLQGQALSPQLGNQNQNQNQGQYSMYSGPPDLTHQDPASATYYGLHQPHGSQHHPPPAALPHSDDLRHEPGQSLPRGLGAGLSRLHFVPAVSLGSGAGSPTPGSTFGASPPGFGGGGFVMDKTAQYGSGLTARLAAAGISGGKPAPPSQSQLSGMMNLHNVRNSNSAWGSSNNSGAPPSRGNMEDEVDEGTLFPMD